MAKVSRDYYRTTAKVIEECLEEWKKRGSLRKDFDAHLFAKGLVASYDGMMVHLAIGTEASEVRNSQDSSRQWNKGFFVRIDGLASEGIS